MEAPSWKRFTTPAQGLMKLRRERIAELKNLHQIYTKKKKGVDPKFQLTEKTEKR
jgi:hypothetical protein